MNKRLIYVFVFAVIVSAAASLVLYRLISTQMAITARTPGSSVVVAARNLDAGALIKEEDLKIATWNGPVPEGAFSVIEKREGTEGVLGRGVVHPIFAGEPVTQGHLGAPGAGAGLAAIIPTGMRAVAVRVNEVVGVSGFATPGMKVDVLVAGNPPGAYSSNQGTLSRTLLQDIEVLSAGQSLQKDAEGKPVVVPVVNLLVNPDQAEILSLASSDARIQLILRNPTDKDVARRPGTAYVNLFTNGAPPPPPPVVPVAPVAAKAAVRPPAPKVVAIAPPPPPPAAPAVVPEKPIPPITVEVIHGSHRAESKFPGEAVKPAEAPVPQPEPAGIPVTGKVKTDGGTL